MGPAVCVLLLIKCRDVAECYYVCHVVESGLYCACACCVWIWCEDFVVCSGLRACVVIACFAYCCIWKPGSCDVHVLFLMVLMAAVFYDVFLPIVHFILLCEPELSASEECCVSRNVYGEMID